MTIDASLLFYWLIAAVVCMPIVVIVRGITAGKRGQAPHAPKKDSTEASDAD